MKLSFRSKLFYGGGDFAINIMWQLTVFYLLFFYTDIFGLSPANAGLVFFLAKIWDAFTDPIMGYIADNTSTRWGKFRPYILFGSVPALIMIILCLPHLICHKRVNFIGHFYIHYIHHFIYNHCYSSWIAHSSDDSRQR